MISAAAEELVQRLLAAGKLSQRAIARTVGISRATVGAIARGQRPAFVARRAEEDRTFFTETHPAQRCPGCGGKVYLPCHVCYVRAYVASMKTTVLSGEAPADKLSTGSFERANTP